MITIVKTESTLLMPSLRLTVVGKLPAYEFKLGLIVKVLAEKVTKLGRVL